MDETAGETSRGCRHPRRGRRVGGDGAENDGGERAEDGGAAPSYWFINYKL